MMEQKNSQNILIPLLKTHCNTSELDKFCDIKLFSPRWTGHWQQEGSH